MENVVNSSGEADLRKMRETRSKAETTQLGMNNSAAIVAREELQFIQGITKIETKEQKRDNMLLIKQYKEEQQLAARQKQTRMQGLDKQRANKLPPTLADTEETKHKEHLINKAQKLLNEEQDDVKKMNSMVLYSKVVTVRDQQCKENKRLQ
jgi:hypothetical protein